MFLLTYILVCRRSSGWIKFVNMFIWLCNMNILTYLHNYLSVCLCVCVVAISKRGSLLVSRGATQILLRVVLVCVLSVCMFVIPCVCLCVCLCVCMVASSKRGSLLVSRGATQILLHVLVSHMVV